MRLPNHATTYAINYWTENTGGYCMVDFIELKDGTVLGISDEVICLYKNIDTWDNGDNPIGIIDRPLLNLNEDHDRKQIILNRIQELKRLVEEL